MHFKLESTLSNRKPPWWLSFPHENRSALGWPGIQCVLSFTLQITFEKKHVRSRPRTLLKMIFPFRKGGICDRSLEGMCSKKMPGVFQKQLCHSECRMKNFSDLSPWLSTPKESSHIFVGSTNCMPRNPRPHRSCFFLGSSGKQWLRVHLPLCQVIGLEDDPSFDTKKKTTPFWKMLTAWLKIHWGSSKTDVSQSIPNTHQVKVYVEGCDFCWGSKGGTFLPPNQLNSHPIDWCLMFCIWGFGNSSHEKRGSKK